MATNPLTPSSSNSRLGLNFNEMNQEVKINNERIYRIAQSLLDRKIDTDTAAPIINEFRARNEYLRQVIEDMYRNFGLKNQLVDCQAEEVTIDKAATGCNGSKEDNFSSSSSNITETNEPCTQEMNRINRKLRPRAKITYTGMDSGVEKSKSRSATKVRSTVNSKTTRTHKFRSLERVNIYELRARGFNRLVSIDDHVKLHGKNLLMVRFYSEVQGEKSFVLCCLDVFDADRSMLKTYLDSIGSLRANHLMDSSMEQLKYVKTTAFDRLSRERLIEIEKSELKVYLMKNRMRYRSLCTPVAPQLNATTPKKPDTETSALISSHNKNCRNRLFNSHQKITRLEAQAKGYTKLVRVIDHHRVQGVTLIMLAMQMESSNDECTFVMSLLDAYDLDKYLLKNYIDAVTGIRGENISANRFKQLNLIRQNNIDEIDRNDLAELEKIELIKAKRHNIGIKELKSIYGKTGFNTSEVISIDSDSDLTETENNNIDDVPSIPRQASPPLPNLEPIDQKPFYTATDAPSPLMQHLIIN